MENLIFGAAYYEEYLPYDRLERDLSLMAEAGMNTIRIAESTWSVCEPKDGEFDFSHVTRTIEAAAKYGISVIVGTPTYAVPVWLAKLDPGILNGNLYGHRQNMDITNPTYRRYAERIIRQTVSRTAGYANVIGFQIDNETKHYGVSSAPVAAGFREWLKKRFGTVEALNYAFGLAHWSNTVASFDELPDPAGTINGSYACAFEAYRRELAADFLKWQSGIVRQYKRPDQFITQNFDYEWRFFGAPGQQNGYSHGLQPDMNFYDAAPAVDIMGSDVYCPAADALTGVEIAFGGDITRPVKRAGYLTLESQSQAFVSWLTYPGQLRLMALSHLASGARGVMYWPWLSIHNGIESYWKGILSHDGEPDATYEEVKETGMLFKRLSPELDGMRKENKIAVIVSPEALHALRWFPTEKNISYNDVLLTIYQTLYEMNLECDILYDRETDWSGYSLLIFPQLYCCTDSMIQKVREFVSDGGCILATFRSFFTDENLKIHYKRQPYGLTDVFGMHYSRFTTGKNFPWMELLESDGAEILQFCQDRHWQKYASITRHDYKTGHAWYMGTMPGPDERKQLLRGICQTAGIEIPVPQWPVVYRRGIAKNGNILHFILNYSENEQYISVPAAGTDLLSGKLYAAPETLCLSGWGAAVLRETARNGI